MKEKKKVIWDKAGELWRVFEFARREWRSERLEK
jgi:hypothetical protein